MFFGNSIAVIKSPVIQIRVFFRRIARQTVKIGKGNRAFLAVCALNFNDGIERDQRDAHIRRMNGDAFFRPAENRVHPVDAFERAAAGSGFAFVARHRHVVKIRTARSL